MKKRQIWASEHHSGEVRSDARPSWWLVGKPMFDFLFALTELFFAICRGSGVMRRNVYNSAVFTGVDLFALNFYLFMVVPRQPFLASENRRHWATQWYIKTASFCVPSFWHNTGLWQTDGQTDGYAPIALYTACKASFAVCCNKNCKQIE